MATNKGGSRGTRTVESEMVEVSGTKKLPKLLDRVSKN